MKTKTVVSSCQTFFVTAIVVKMKDGSNRAKLHYAYTLLPGVQFYASEIDNREFRKAKYKVIDWCDKNGYLVED